MKRSQRLETVKKVVDDFERRKAEALAVSERRVKDSEKKLADLETYRDGYVREFAVRAQAGIGAAAARDYQAFLARLDDALKQQAQAVETTRTQRDTERKNWQHAAQRAEVIETTMKRWQGEEQDALEKREQRDSDERSARLWLQSRTSNGT